MIVATAARGSSGGWSDAKRCSFISANCYSRGLKKHWPDLALKLLLKTL